VVANPVTGYLYAVFADKGAGLDKGDIYLSISTDHGATWSPRQRINSDATSNDQWQPTLAITPDGQHLGIFWYDRRLDAADNLIDYFGRVCDIGGGAFVCGSDFRVSDASFLPEFGRDGVLNSVYMGDYDVAAADDSFFYVAWGDNLLALDDLGRQNPNVFFDTIPIGSSGTAIEPSAWATISAALGALALACARRRRGLVV